MNDAQDVIARWRPAPVGPVAAARLIEAWRLAQRAHVNLLVMGVPRFERRLKAAAGMRHFVEALLPDMPKPLASWSPGERLILPPVGSVQTLILHDVGLLGPSDQMRVLDWSECTEGDTRIVSTTPDSLLPRIRSGQFLASLYYRLNIICVNLAA